MILLALGANLPSREGSPRETLRRAGFALEARGLVIMARSRLFMTEPIPRSSQPWYVNQVLAVDTTLEPRALLEQLLAVEQVFGRRRGERNAPRTLDLDLILYGDAVIDQPGLIVPHPRFRTRRFVLEPLAEVAAGMRDPVSGRTVRELLGDLGGGIPGPV